MSVAPGALRLAPPESLRCASDAELVRRYADGDLELRGVIAERHMGLARNLAARHRDSREAREDLEQVAYVALLKAIDRYDPDAGSFVGYAIQTIRGELKRHFRDRGWTMRVPRPMQEHYMAVNAAIERLTASQCRSPTASDLAEETGLTMEEVLEAMDLGDAYAPSALDAPLGTGDGSPGTLGDVVGGEDPGYSRVELGVAIGPAFRDLPEREQAIVRLRFIDDLTQAEIAGRVGISQMHVSRLLSRSLKQLSGAVQA